MEVTIRDHLMAAIAHLGVKRAKLVTELNQVEVVLNGLRREVDSFGQHTASIPFPDNDTPSVAIYGGMSVRWSVLMYLAEHDTPIATVGMIAEALREGGLSSKGMNFNSNVSAVLSQMTGRGEVEKQADRFVLTPHGTQAWERIKQSDKFKSRLEAGGLQGN